MGLFAHWNMSHLCYGNARIIWLISRFLTFHDSVKRKLDLLFQIAKKLKLSKKVRVCCFSVGLGLL